MKHDPVKQRKGKVVPVRPLSEQKTDKAFDIWLQRGLHELFDDVASEAVPEELLEIIRQARDPQIKK